MKKLGSFAFVFFIVFFIFSVNCFACTSFAVYSQKTYYGANFDQTTDNIRFSIKDAKVTNTRVFSMDYYYYNGYGSAIRMNNYGLFSSNQYVYPKFKLIQELSEGQISISDFSHRAAYNTDNVKDIRDFITDKSIICKNVNSHALYADKYKDAMVLETDNKENWITNINGKSIVMTNFFNYQIKDFGIDNVNGQGVYRYIKATEYIDSHIDDFSYDDGMAVLKSVRQTVNTIYPTQCSMLFDPENQEVFIAMKGNFDKVWKVSIKNRTIETYKGFDTHQISTIDENGFIAADLENLGKSTADENKADNIDDNSEFNMLWVIGTVFSLFIIGVIILALVRAKSKNNVG